MNTDPNDASDSAIEWQVDFDVCGQSDIGNVRELNEDQFLILELQKRTKVLSSSFEIDDSHHALDRTKGLIMVVADGVGGAAAGERASQLAIETIYDHLRNHMPWFLRLHNEHKNELVHALKSAVQKCELAVEHEAELTPSESGMGTTLTLAYLLWPSLYVVHVGDSRCYLYRNTQLLQVTRDHTFAQALLEAGHLKQHEARTRKYSNVLVNSIGRGMDELHPEVYNAEMQPGDKIVLCSDGLYNMISDELISYLLSQNLNSEEACRHLLAKANAAGGADNTTVIVCQPLIQE